MSERSPMTRYFAPEGVNRLQRWGLIAAALGGLACLVGGLADGEQLFRSSLIGVLYWLGIALGCLGLLMVQHLTGGDWGVVMRRVLEASARTLWVLLPLFLLLFLGGMEPIFSWAREGAMAGDHALEHKQPYLNVPFFWVRLAVYFAIWLALTLILTRLSLKQDRVPDPRLVKRMQAVAAPGIILYVLSASFASYDWLMSLEPHWYSTMYGVYFVGTHGIGALAFLIVMGVFLARQEPMSQVLAPRHFHDYGKLLFAFILLWTYFSISQFLIIWSGNLPEEIAWYLHRFRHGWVWLAAALLIFHFGVPFALLLSRSLKKNARRLAVVAIFMLVMRWLDLVWQVAPVYSPGRLRISWLDLAAPVFVGGVWLFAFVWNLKKRPLLPINDPYLEEAMGHGHG